MNSVMKHVLYLFLMVLGACSTAQEKTHFPEKALKDTLLTFDGLEKNGRRSIVSVQRKNCGLGHLGLLVW